MRVIENQLFNSELNPAFCQYNVLVAQLKYSEKRFVL